MCKACALALILLTGCTTHPIKEVYKDPETATAAELAAATGTAPTPRLMEMPPAPTNRREINF